MCSLSLYHPKIQAIVLFSVGIAGIVAEAVGHLVYVRTADPTLILVFAAMLGLPAVLQRRNGPEPK